MKLNVAIAATIVLVILLATWMPAHWYMPDQGSSVATKYVADEDCSDHHNPRLCARMREHELSEPRRKLGKRLLSWSMVLLSVCSPFGIAFAVIDGFSGYGAPRNKTARTAQRICRAIFLCVGIAAVMCLVISMPLAMWE